jgi:hypothetical protein
MIRKRHATIAAEHHGHTGNPRVEFSEALYLARSIV